MHAGLPVLIISLRCLLLVSEARAADDPVGIYDPGQLPGFNGQVQQFTLSPRGEIDGLILKDGTEVKTPPHLSTSIAYAIKPGDAVTIHGLRAAALPLVQAASITDHASGRTIVDTGPEPGPGPGPRPQPGPRQGQRPGPNPAGPPPPPGVSAEPPVEPQGTVELQGTVRMSLHGARGEINGVLLNDGTVLRFPPDAAADFANLLQPGKGVVVQGAQVLSPVGKVMDVRAIGATHSDLSPIFGD